MSRAAARVPDRPSAAARALDAVVLGIAAGASGVVGWALAQLGMKGLVLGFAALVVFPLFVLAPRRELLALVLMVLSLVLLLHKSFGPIAEEIASGPPSVYVTTFDMVLVLLYGLWLLEGTLVRDLTAALRRPVFWAPPLAALLAMVSVLAARDVPLAAAEVVRMGWMCLLFVYVAVRIRTRTDVWVTLGALAAVACIQFGVVLMQWRTGGVLGLSFLGVPTQLGERTLDTGQLGRPFGTITHPVFMGALLGALALVALSLAIHLRRPWQRLAALALVLVCLAPCVISHTRAAAIAFGAAALVLCGVSLRRGLIPRGALWAAGLLGAVAVLAFWPQISEQFRDNFGTDHFDLEVRSRVELNHVALAMASDRPLTGLGLNNFQQVMDDYDRYGLIFAGNPVHNLFLLQLAETGVLGLLGTAVIAVALGTVALRLARVPDPLFAAVGSGVAAVYGFFLLEEQLGFSLREDVPLAVFWILAGLSVACLRIHGEEARAARPAPGARRVPRPRTVLVLAVAAVLAAPGTAVADAPAAGAGLRIVFAASDRHTGLQAIYTVEAGGEVRRLSPDDGAFYDWPSWALGGTKIVYTRRVGVPGSPEDLFLMNPDGSGSRQLTFTGWRNAQPKVSPDGRHVVFTSMWDEFPVAALYSLDLRTLAVTNLSAIGSPSGAMEADPRFTPDGRLVFARSARGTRTIPSQVWLLRPGKAGRRQVTGSRSYDTDPDVSPDGRDVAFSSYRGAGSPSARDPGDPLAVKPSDWHIVVRDLRTGTERTLTEGRACFMRPPGSPCGPLEGAAFVPVWMPEGGAVGFVAPRSSTRVCICVASVSGGPPQVVLDSPLAITWFDWMRPGLEAPPAPPAVGAAEPRERLLFGGTRDGRPLLAIGSPDRWTSLPLPLPRRLRPTSARWSPDRRQIVFTARVPYARGRFAPHPRPPRDRRRVQHFTLDFLQRLLSPAPARPAVAEQQVFLLDIADGHVRQLTDPWIEDYLDGLQPGDARGNIEPSFTADGRAVLFTNVSSISEETFLLRLDLDSGRVVNLTSATAGAIPVADAAPRASPGGERVAFASTAPGHGTDVYTADVGTGRRVRRITRDRFVETAPAWSPDGRSLVYARFRGRARRRMPSAEPSVAAAAAGANPPRGWQLVVIDVATRRKSVVMRDRRRSAFAPEWSPDGRRIGFISVSARGEPDIYVVDRAGGAARPLQPTQRSHELFFDWR